MQSRISNWWLVRHAPVSLKILYGQLDVDADFGDQAAFSWLAACLPSNARWITSDLSRCVQTANKILTVKDLNSAALSNCPALREQNFGDWQGFTYSEIEERNPTLYKSFWENPAGNVPPGGESFEDLIGRVRPVPSNFQHQEHHSENIIVAHAGTIRALLLQALCLSPDVALGLEIAPLSLTKLTLYETNDEQHWQICWINRIAGT